MSEARSTPLGHRRMKTSLHVVLIALALIIIAIVALGGLFLIHNRTNGTLTSSGETRRYLLYVPPSYDPATPTPLVLSFHGFAEWPAHQRDLSEWNELADREGFIVVYPAGTGLPLRWRTHGRAVEGEDPFVDVVFIADLIDELSQAYTLDPTRIYANGLSNGGGMTHMLACTLSDRIAAIGTVAGAYTLPWSECEPDRPVPVIAFHGDDDPIVPYEGGPSDGFDVPFPDVTTWARSWADHNGCRESPVELPPAGEVTGVHYTECNGDADVIFHTIHGGGHSWPGGDPLPAFIVGHTTDDIDATETMWDFFVEHPMGSQP